VLGISQNLLCQNSADHDYRISGTIGIYSTKGEIVASDVLGSIYLLIYPESSWKYLVLLSL
jgi:hypothetical protein